MNTIDEIHKLIVRLADEDYKHRTMPEFLALLEEGEEWVTKMEELLNGK